MDMVNGHLHICVDIKFNFYAFLGYDILIRLKLHVYFYVLPYPNRLVGLWVIKMKALQSITLINSHLFWFVSRVDICSCPLLQERSNFPTSC